jgi:hypothetical protein
LTATITFEPDIHSAAISGRLCHPMRAGVHNQRRGPGRTGIQELFMYWHGRGSSWEATLMDRHSRAPGRWLNRHRPAPRNDLIRIARPRPPLGQPPIPGVV